ncbi:unnamed protein product [Cyprideis torosa]|uniref:AB hydrolase-1 domain-containing protein n=1 Tax=Cyprideis torosa TaxID=163714 RepID=A0A7R8ZJ91_9CRUS|nr:unnamed protein product [Cyprideis torosa]CAG0886365.1 unnamed protein product [Cyprideis torosa]
MLFTMILYLWKCMIGPRLNAVLIGHERLNIVRYIGILASPVLIPAMYRRGMFEPDGLRQLLQFSIAIFLVYASARALGGLGRLVNPTYRQFMDETSSITPATHKGVIENLIRKYDCDFRYWPAYYNASGKTPELFQLPANSSYSEGIVWDWLSGPVAHTVARRLMYPGSLQLMQDALRKNLLDSRLILMTKHSGQRRKIRAVDGNDIDTMFVDRRGSSGSNGEYLVICCEGNAGFYEFGIMGTPLKRNYSVLGWNHPGFEGSSGLPFPSQEFSAIEAVMEYGNKELGFPIDKIVVYAWSIGGFTAAHAARCYPDIKGLIIDASFDDVLPLATPKFPSPLQPLIRATIRRHFDLNVARLLHDFSGPVLLYRRTRDEIITVIEGRMSTNRGNDLLESLLVHRFPHVFDSQGKLLLRKWLDADTTDRGERMRIHCRRQNEG